jgi:preprotein translocase subunit SecD
MLSLTLMLGCQRPTPGPVPIKPIAVRLEVAEGTEGAISYYSEGSRETVWFGPAHYFDLAEVGPSSTASGGNAIFFLVTKKQELEFSDLTQFIKGNRMAIEVDGIIYCAPTVNERLPGAGIISGGLDGLSMDEYNRIMSYLTVAKAD